MHPNPTNIHTLHFKRSQTPVPDIYRQFRTTKVTDRHQQTSQHIPRHPMRLFEDVWRFMLRLNDVCWCLLVFVGVCWCLILSYVVWRCAEGVWIVSQKVSECCLWTCKCLGSCEGVFECSSLEWCSKCSISYIVWSPKSALYGCVKALGSYDGVSECSGLVGCSKCSILEYLRKAKLCPPDTFETSKYQNLPI